MNDFNALLEDFADTLPKLNKWVVLVIRILAILILVFGVVYFFTGCESVENSVQTKVVSYPVRLVANCFYDGNVTIVPFSLKENKELSFTLDHLNKDKYTIIVNPENKEKLIVEYIYQNKNLVSVIIYTNDIKNIDFQFHFRTLG